MTVTCTIRPLAAVLLCSLAMPAAMRAAEAPAVITAAVDRAVRPLMKDYDVPGFAVAVTVGGRHYFFNYGVASQERRTPVTRDTLFEIGSVSKTFTATLAGYAAALGKVSLDDHPGKYVPELRDSAVDKASLLELGTFTAGGLPLQFPEDVRTNDKMIAYFRQWKPAAAPGTMRQYSNPSIGLFGHVVAVAMKQDFASLIERDIFPKLGLEHSYIHVPTAAMPDYAWGYNKSGRPIRVNPGMFDAEAYGVKSSAADMIHFVDDNIRPDARDASIRQAIEGTHAGYIKSGELVQDLGWEQYPYPATLETLLAGNAATMTMERHPATRLMPPRTGAEPTLFNKTGSTNGFSAYGAFVPAKGIGLVMLANKNVPIPARVKAGYAVINELARAAAR